MSIPPRSMLLGARAVSVLFSPHYMVVYAFALVLCVSHLSLLPLAFRAMVLAIVWLFSVLAPRLFLKLYVRLTKVERAERASKKHSTIAYLFTLASYTALLYLLVNLQSSFLMVSVILSACTTVLIAMLSNLFYRVNPYALATAGAVGLLMSLSLMYHFEAALWICLLVLCSGLVCSAQLFLRRCRLGEVGAGIAIGFIVPMVSLLWL